MVIMKKKINEIDVRMDLYPRLEVDVKKVQEYSENVELLPPIDINQNNILIDGLHRLKAHKQAKLTEIEVNVIKTESENDVVILSIEKNAKHGLMLSYRDKQSLANKLFDGKNANRLIKTLSISERTFRNWVAHKTRQLKEERDEKIINLYLQCWTQEKIGEEVGCSQKEVSNILENFSKNGKIAEITKTFKPFTYNHWAISQLSSNDNKSYFGFFPEIFMENLIFYYTKPFDVVFDPMAGSGTTARVCKKWFRRYYVSDIEPNEVAKMVGVRKYDITQGLPTDLPKPNFVFLDPPYWKQAQGEYTKLRTDFSNMTLESFYGQHKILFKSLYKKIKDGGWLCFVIQGTQWRNNLKLEDHAIKFYRLLEDIGFIFEQRIILPYPTTVYNPQQVEKSKEKKILLTLYRDLVVFKKGGNGES